MDTNTIAIIVLLGTFALMILLRFPIAYAVGLSSVFCLMVMGNSLADVCRLMVAGISSYSLMAVPFFITMGVLMGSGGISDRLIALANACVGWMRGGLAMVNIVASYFFGGISGSAAADTASIGSIMIPMMVDQGYDDDFSTAVTITSSCEGLLVPPSHNMVIYSMTAGSISVGSLFLAGYLPGAILAIAGWLRYLLAVDDSGEPMECSADPMLETLQGQLSGVKLGDPASAPDAVLAPILSNPALFAVDLCEAGLADKIGGMVREMLAGPGAVRNTLEKYLSR